MFRYDLENVPGYQLRTGVGGPERNGQDPIGVPRSTRHSKGIPILAGWPRRTRIQQEEMMDDEERRMIQESEVWFMSLPPNIRMFPAFALERVDYVKGLGKPIIVICEMGQQELAGPEAHAWV